MAPPAPERVMKIDARGSKKKPHRSNFAPQGVLWSPPGESWAPSRPQKSALGGKEEFQKNYGGLLGPPGGPLGASWAHFGSHFPPPWGAPGRLQEVIFGPLWDVLAEVLKMSFCLSIFSHIWGLFFCATICPLLSSLLRGWRRRAYAKN